MRKEDESVRIRRRGRRIAAVLVMVVVDVGISTNRSKPQTYRKEISPFLFLDPFKGTIVQEKIDQATGLQEVQQWLSLVSTV